MTLNQIYNKSIILKAPLIEPVDFDLFYYVYNGKLSIIADHFNKISISQTVKLVNQFKENRSNLQIAAFLGFSNIFLYLLTFDADIYHQDENLQNLCHFINYKGEIKNLLILFNFLKFRLKMETLEAIENLKKTYNLSKIDVNKGKLSQAVNQTGTNLKRFETFQKYLREEAYNLIAKTLKIFQILFSQKDKEGRNSLHYSAMSKYPLCYLVTENILEFDLFKEKAWEEFLVIYDDLQNLEVKKERIIDPRRCLRIEKEFTNLLGPKILIELSQKFKEGKNEIIKNIINSKDNILDSVLHVAAFHGDYRIVNKLIIFQADKTSRNQEDKLPVDLAKDNYVRKVLTNLNKAAKNSDSKNITELVHFGHDINSKLSIFNQAPIHKIIESSKQDKHLVLKKMLDLGADPNIQDSNGWTPLHYSAELGDFESVRILLENKAQIDCFSNNKKTPLHFAASHNFADIVKYILEKANFYNEKNNYSLNKNDLLYNKKDTNGCTALHLAARHGAVESIAIMLAFGSDLYAEDFRKWNILHYAAFQGHSKAIRFISKYDCDFNILKNSRNSQNKLAIEIVRDHHMKHFFGNIWECAKEGNLDLLRNLVNEGENINEKSTFLSNTPLHMAVFNNHYLMVRLLLENKVKLNVKNKDSITAEEYSELIYIHMERFYSKQVSEGVDYMSIEIDFRDIIRNILNINEKVLNSLISGKNYKVKLWKMMDFSVKINGLFKEQGKQMPNISETNNSEISLQK